MPGRRTLIPSLPLPRRLLPWLLFLLGLLSLGYGAIAGEFAALTIGVVAIGGALLSWAAEWLLGPPERNDE